MKVTAKLLLACILSLPLFSEGKTNFNAIVTDSKDNSSRIENIKINRELTVLHARKGASYIAVPFTRIKEIKFTSPLKQKQRSAELTLLSDKKVSVEISCYGTNGWISFSGDSELGKVSVPSQLTKKVSFETALLGVVCPHCKKVYYKKWSFCPHDGKKLRPQKQ